jgi:hypothetical protein
MSRDFFYSILSDPSRRFVYCSERGVDFIVADLSADELDMIKARLFRPAPCSSSSAVEQDEADMYELSTIIMHR